MKTHEHENKTAPAGNILHRKLTKEEINQLDIIIFDGPVHLIDTRDNAIIAARTMKHEKLIGLDTETRPAFKKGVSYPPSLLQMATANEVFIFQLSKTGLPGELRDMLSSPHIIKTGVAIDRDVKDLRKLEDFKPRAFVDLGTCAKNNGMKHHGLRGLTALLLGRRLTKQARLTNWAKPKLSQAALTYAATDAWISRRVYEVMKDVLKYQGIFSLVKDSLAPSVRNSPQCLHFIASS